MKKISNKFHQEALTITTFFGDFCSHNIKSFRSSFAPMIGMDMDCDWKKLGKLFQVSIHVHPCHRCKRRPKTVSIPKYSHVNDNARPLYNFSD